MNRLLVLALVLLIIVVFPHPSGGQDLVIVGGQRFVTETGTFVPNSGIQVRGGRILSFGDARPFPKVAHGTPLGRVQLKDEDHILPGIVDLHAHYNVMLFGRRRRDETSVNPVVYLANGVTTTFPAGEYDPDRMLDLRRRIERGEAIGPRVLTSGPYFGSVRRSWSHDKPIEDVYAEVDAWVGKGAKGFKAKGIRAHHLKALIDRAHHHGLTVTAHLDSGFRGSVNPKDAILLGIDRIEHFLGGDALPPTKTAYESLARVRPDQPEIDAIIKLYIDSGVCFDATLTAFGYFGKRAEGYDYWFDEPSLFTPYVRKHGKGLELPDKMIRLFDEIYSVKRKVIKKFFDAGGTISLGTDHFSSGAFLPGFSAHRELDAFVLSGIPAGDAIKIATINGAKAIGLGDRLGSITPGKIADLFVVTGSPLVNIRNTRKVHTVFKSGVKYDTRELLESVKGKLGPTDASEQGEW